MSLQHEQRVIARTAYVAAVRSNLDEFHTIRKSNGIATCGKPHSQ